MRTTIRILVVLAMASSAFSQNVRVGTFDSRAVALAYYNSPASSAEMKSLSEELRAAKHTHNAARQRELSQQMQGLQALEHLQVFSHASIANVLARLEQVLPAVAKEAGVAMIVSEWEIAWRDPQVEYVDVTARLVETFKPDERVRKWLADLEKRKPMPLTEIAAMAPEH